MCSESWRDRSALVTVGKVLNVHGLLGGVKAQVLSDVSNRFEVGQTVYISGTSHLIVSSTPAGPGQVQLRFQGVNSPEAARLLVGEMMTVPECEVPRLPEGEYFHFQLLGLRVQTEEGEVLGRISEILETGSNDVYVVTGEDGEVLVPAIRDVVREIEVAKGTMTVRLLQGLR